jgi:hypothetical protein
VCVCIYLCVCVCVYVCVAVLKDSHFSYGVQPQSLAAFLPHLPLAIVFLTRPFPRVDPVTVALVIGPVSNVRVFVLVGHCALAVALPFDKLALNA